MEQLIKIQNELKVPKGNYNSFGKYKYRSAEDILEAVKPILAKYNAVLRLTDDIHAIGNKLFLKSSARIWFGDIFIESNGFAELSEHKGMSAEQCTGTASSYARKYALNGLFLIDETEQDADNDNKQVPVKPYKDLLTDAKFNAMVKAIKDGNKQAVKLKMDLYEMLPEQREELNKLLK